MEPGTGMLIALAALYFAPWLIAVLRRHHNAAAIVPSYGGRVYTRPFVPSAGALDDEPPAGERLRVSR
jgi:hypothetical protein